MPYNPVMPPNSVVLHGLNPEQADAVDTLDGPLLVIAGAGTGKTRVITRRIARLIESGIPAQKILAVTFTNKAAREMGNRVAAMIGRSGPLIATFHGFGARFLREQSAAFGRSDEFTLYDRADSESAVKIALDQLGLDRTAYPPKEILESISRAKSTLTSCQAFREEAMSSFDRDVASIYDVYDELLQKSDAFDFDDLISLPVFLLEKDKELREAYNQRYSHILIDEYQDVNELQYRLGVVLSGSTKNLCVTGDPDQCIYTWRGADITYILRFKEYFPEAKIVRLEQNYRSVNTILEAASAVIKFNTKREDKHLWSEKGQGEPIQLQRVADDIEEAQSVAYRIEELVDRGVSRKDIAVFYRLNSLSLPIERALISQNIPYNVFRGLEFFKRREVKDLVAWLRYLANPKDTVSLKRIINTPPRGIGNKTFSVVEELARQQFLTPGEILERKELLSSALTKRAVTALAKFSKIDASLRSRADGRIADVLQAALSESGLGDHLKKQAANTGQDPWGNLQQLIGYASDYQKVRQDGTITTFLEEVALFTDSDTPTEEIEKISLMTIHCAKGLEYPHCIIVGMDDGIFPHRGHRGPADVEEERRLFYVGLTRAMESMLLLTCFQRSRFGRSEFAKPSIFLTEIPEELTVAVDDTSGTTDSFEPEIEYEMDESFQISVGARVSHNKFGSGTVTRVSGRNANAKVEVHFDSGDQRKLVLKYAGLTALEHWD
ncbi:MAG: DNA helicase-2/ATP-dependent DNA helicase PcrA [Planctomycetota bacterium]|jgi:DNA helicase-2/ATP-dependent DNA helicase PcrA